MSAAVFFFFMDIFTTYCILSFLSLYYFLVSESHLFLFSRCQTQIALCSFFVCLQLWFIKNNFLFNSSFFSFEAMFRNVCKNYTFKPCNKPGVCVFFNVKDHFTQIVSYAGTSFMVLSRMLYMYVGMTQQGFFSLSYSKWLRATGNTEITLSHIITEGHIEASVLALTCISISALLIAAQVNSGQWRCAVSFQHVLHPAHRHTDSLLNAHISG